MFQLNLTKCRIPYSYLDKSFKTGEILMVAVLRIK